MIHLTLCPVLPAPSNLCSHRDWASLCVMLKHMKTGSCNLCMCPVCKCFALYQAKQPHHGVGGCLTGFDQEPAVNPESSTRIRWRGHNLDNVIISLLRACINYKSRDTRCALCVSSQLLAFGEFALKYTSNPF